MGMSHHGSGAESNNDEQVAHMKRLIEQISGTARREYPAGRMGAQDDGALSYAIAADPPNRVIVIRFGKPVEWIGLGIDEAQQLRDSLDKKILELRGISV